MKSFASDNNSGIHPQIMQAIIDANDEHALGYGDDLWTQTAESAVKNELGKDVEPLFVFNGTGSNVVALQLMTRSYNSILCAETAHIYVDECGAPVKMTGAQIRPIATKDGKLTPELIKPYLIGFGDQHHSQPSAIYISQSTELGTIYSIDELKAITALAHQHGMHVHMDGARIANACAALNVSLREMVTDCAIDTVTLGGTKNGMMMGECVVVLCDDLKPSAKFVRKQSAQLASKMRYLSCQFSAYLTDELWLKNAKHANEMAIILAAGFNQIKGATLTQSLQTNQIFISLPRDLIDILLKHYFFYFWNEANNEVRFVTSYDTYKEDVEDFIAILHHEAGKLGLFIEKED